MHDIRDFPHLDRWLSPVVSQWSNQHRQAAHIMQIWHEHGIQFGVFSSQPVWLTNRALHRTSPPADDIDVLVKKDDFYRAVRLLPQVQLYKRRWLHALTQDNYHQSCHVDEAVYDTGSDTLQFMYPRNPIRCFKCSLTSECHLHYSTYRWRFSQLAYENSLYIQTAHGAVVLTHPFDTIALYGIMQRTQKDDITKIATLSHLLEQWPEINGNTSYAQLRAQELNLDDRVYRYIQAAAPHVIDFNEETLALTFAMS